MNDDEMMMGWMMMRCVLCALPSLPCLCLAWLFSFLNEMSKLFHLQFTKLHYFKNAKNSFGTWLEDKASQIQFRYKFCIKFWI
jgi:hypothetical protein